MTAQIGSAVLLGYGPQGTRQPGDSVLLSYSPPAGVQRRLMSGTAIAWGAAQTLRTNTQVPFLSAKRLHVDARGGWAQGQGRELSRSAGWVLAHSIDRSRVSPWGEYLHRLRAEPRMSWGLAKTADTAVHTLWGQYARWLALQPQLPWGTAYPADESKHTLWGEYSGQPIQALSAAWLKTRPADATRHMPWVRFSRPLDAGWGVVIPVGGVGPDEPAVIVTIRRTSIVINSITLRRVDTGAELHAHGFSMSLDYQSWTWTWNASLHRDAEAHLGRDSQGDPAELEVVVNGIPFRLRLERIVCDRRFNPTRWAVSGKGKASILGAGYAPVMSFGNTAARTAQQLMADALTVNGASLGWAVDWGLADWLVPAGAWSMRGSYIDAINDIATAAGGYVQPHNTDATLRILPRYPAAPWDWGSVTPDFEIPDDAAEVEGTEYIDKPAYNKVFVGGVGAGVFGPFKRAGTAGDSLAPQVTHALITDAEAHRQRGLAELSDTGRQEHITLKMQVLPETGIIMPGQFVRYVGGKAVMGIVRSTSIDWSRPVLRQTIGIETHA